MTNIKLTTKAAQLIEAIIANPHATHCELAEIVGINRNTITQWKRNPDFQAALSERIKEVWRDSEVEAVANMRKLANEGCFQANKYILDSLGYAPVEKHKVEAEVNSDIHITIE